MTGVLQGDEWDAYLISGTQVLRNKLDIDNADVLRLAENDLVEARIAELRASPIMIRQTWDVTHLRALHKQLFQDVYEWAGDLRTVGISKGGESFVPPMNILQPLEHFTSRIAESERLASIAESQLPAELAYLYDYVNYAHPFREGNGRTQREFFDQLLSRTGRGLNWLLLVDDELHEACHQARTTEPVDLSLLQRMFDKILTSDPAY